MLIDDEKNIADGFAYTIRENFSSRVSLHVFYDALEALEYSKNHPVSLLISDISMPELDGITLAKKMKEISNEFGEKVLFEGEQKIEESKKEFEETHEELLTRVSEKTEAAKGKLAETKDKLAETTEAARDKFAETTEAAKDKIVETTETARDRIIQNQKELQELQEKYKALLTEKSRGFKHLVKAFPDMTSKYHNEILQKYKQQINSKKK